MKKSNYEKKSEPNNAYAENEVANEIMKFVVLMVSKFLCSMSHSRGSELTAADHRPRYPEKEEKETVVNSGLTFMQWLK